MMNFKHNLAILEAASTATAKEIVMNTGNNDRGRTSGAEPAWDQRRITCALVAVGLSLLFLILASAANAQGVVQAWGMGGASTAGSRGLEAVVYNPANLAFSDGTTVGLAAAAADIHNNASSFLLKQDPPYRNFF